MDEYLSLLILAYFKEQKSYTIGSISKLLGISSARTLSILETLIERGCLQYEENLLCLSTTGRLTLQNHHEDVYSFDNQTIEIPKVDISSAWSIDQIYVPDGFLKKL